MPEAVLGPDPSFWNGRSVLITGHTGFKGSWLCLWLHRLGARVSGYALEPPTQPNLFTQADVSRSVETTIADLREASKLAAVIRERCPEVVFHLAAQSVVSLAHLDPVETYSVNLMGTVLLFDAIRRWGGPCALVNVTSDKCYAPHPSGRPYAENDPLGGEEPYASSKACAELVTEAFRRSYFSAPVGSTASRISLASARAGNVIGGGDWTPYQLVPDLIRAFVEGRTCRLRNPAAIRPWQHVLEPLRGYLLLAERLVRNASPFDSAWNFGPQKDDARRVDWIASWMAEHWGAGSSWVADGGDHPAETMVLRLDATKAERELGWNPSLSLEPTLEWTLEWYRAWHRGENLADLTRVQLEEYCGHLGAGIGAGR